MHIFRADLEKDKDTIVSAKKDLLDKISKHESKLAKIQHPNQRRGIEKNIAEMQTQLKQLDKQEHELLSRQPMSYWVRQAQSVQDRGLRAHVTAERTWDTLALGKVLTGFMRDVYAGVLGVSGDTEVHAAKEMVYLFSNAMEQRNVRAHSRHRQNFPMANVLDAVHCLYDIALRCARATGDKVDATAVAELGDLCEQMKECRSVAGQPPTPHYLVLPHTTQHTTRQVY